MGPVGSILTLAVFAGLAYTTLKLWSGERCEWPLSDLDVSEASHRVLRVVALLLTTLLGVHLIDAYIVDVAMPFAPRQVDLPAHVPTEVAPQVPVEPSPAASSTVQAEHERAVRDWADRMVDGQK